MELLFFAAMLCLLAYVTYRNVVLFMRYRRNKEYVECYQAMLKKEENAYDRLVRYLETEKSPEFINRAKILKIFADMDLSEANPVSDLDLKEIYYKNGRYSSRQLSYNAESFIWLYLDLAKARRLSRFDVIEALADKINVLPEMQNRVEYRLFKAIENALCEKEDAGVEFLSGLLEGNYVGLEYEKQLIALYKRFAAATLAYSGEPMEDYYKEDLRNFAGTMIGQTYMSELEIIDKYPPLGMETEEAAENKEE